MTQHRRFTVPKGILWSALVVGMVLMTPRVASSQARGSLQVSATVVNTQPSLAALTAASVAAQTWVTTGKQLTNDVSTVAQVTVGYDAVAPAPGAHPAALVIDIAYLKN